MPATVFATRPTRPTRPDSSGNHVPGRPRAPRYVIVRGGLRQFLRAQADPLGIQGGRNRNACYVAATETRSRRRTSGTRIRAGLDVRGRRRKRRRAARRRARLPRQERRRPRRHQRRRRRPRRHEPVPQLAQRRHARQPQPARGRPRGLRRARDGQRRRRRACDLRRRQPRPARRKRVRRRRACRRPRRSRRPRTGSTSPSRRICACSAAKAARRGRRSSRRRDLDRADPGCGSAGSRPRTACAWPGSSSSTTRRTTHLWNATSTPRRASCSPWTTGRRTTALEHADRPSSGPAARRRQAPLAATVISPSPVDDGSSYRVFEFPKESPNDGPRDLVNEPGRRGRVAVRLARHERHRRAPSSRTTQGQQRPRVPRPGRQRRRRLRRRRRRRAGSRLRLRRPT